MRASASTLALKSNGWGCGTPLYKKDWRCSILSERFGYTNMNFLLLVFVLPSALAASANKKIEKGSQSCTIDNRIQYNRLY